MSNKMQFLYKAFDDVTATIRALDTKASYLLAIVIFLGGSYYGIIKDIYAQDSILVFHFFPFCFLILSILFYIFALSPYNNLSDKLLGEDAKTVKNNFFIATQNKIIQSKDIFTADLTDAKITKKIVAIEILKLSYLRDTKIKYVKYATYSLQLFIAIAFGIILFTICNYRVL